MPRRTRPSNPTASQKIRYIIGQYAGLAPELGILDGEPTYFADGRHNVPYYQYHLEDIQKVVLARINTGELCQQFMLTLITIVERDEQKNNTINPCREFGWHLIKATAEQWCEAFLVTMNEWQDEYRT